MAASRLGIAIPQRTDALAPESMLALAQSIDRDHDGVSSIWVADRVLGSTNHLDPIALMSAMAALTSRVEIGPAVAVGLFRNPLVLAHQLASLDQLSGGRAIAGIGYGSPTLRAAGGEDDGPLGPVADEYVHVLAALLRGVPVTASRREWRLEGAVMSPLPVRRMPLWLSGHASGAIRRAAQIADGWIGSGLVGAAQWSEDIARLRSALAAEGRSDFAVAKRVYVHIPSACTPEHRTLDAWTSAIFGAVRAVDFVVCGSADEVLGEVRALVGAGVEHVVLDPVYSERSHVEAVLEAVEHRL
jgi:alkanesulfonate monooxygenase SsuD/methylene tetrahydromethanopterin reductase-like flavin-dependent oxidoreductase (luciferase family)